jgi:hypothetical protein
MACKITFSLLEESLRGDIGDDWTYTVEAVVLNPTVTGSGMITVKEHRLRPGSTQAVPGAMHTVAIPAGPCETGAHVELTLRAREVDFLVDDRGSNVIMVPVECPGLNGPPFTIEPEIEARVREAPGFLGGEATLTVKARLVSTCV